MCHWESSCTSGTQVTIFICFTHLNSPKNTQSVIPLRMGIWKDRKSGTRLACATESGIYQRNTSDTLLIGGTRQWHTVTSSCVCQWELVYANRKWHSPAEHDWRFVYICHKPAEQQRHTTQNWEVSLPQPRSVICVAERNPRGRGRPRQCLIGRGLSTVST